MFHQHFLMRVTHLRPSIVENPNTITQPDHISTKVPATVVARHWLEPHNFRAQFPSAILNFYPACRHSQKRSLRVIRCPPICRRRDSARGVLCMTVSTNRYECLKLLTMISLFSVFNQPTNSLWICTSISCLLGKSLRVVLGLIATRQFLNIGFSPTARA
jgi:hypothetical protein